MKKQNSPEVATAFSCGKLLTAKIYEQPRYIKARDAYCYRIKCVFSNGMEKMVQTAYKTREEALAEYPVYAQYVQERRICIFKCNVEDFYTYWLEQYLYKTKKTPKGLIRLYTEIISRYLLPAIGKYLLNNITEEELEEILGKIWSDNDFDSMCIVLIKSFETALEYHCIDENVAMPAVAAARNRRMLARMQIPFEKKNYRDQIKKAPEIPVGKIYENPFDDDYLLELME